MCCNRSCAIVLRLGLLYHLCRNVYLNVEYFFYLLYFFLPTSASPLFLPSPTSAFPCTSTTQRRKATPSGNPGVITLGDSDDSGDDAVPVDTGINSADEETAGEAQLKADFLLSWKLQKEEQGIPPSPENPRGV